MLERVRWNLKKIRRTYIVTALILIMAVGCSFLLLRAIAASADYKSATATIVVAGDGATSFYEVRVDPNSHELAFDLPRRHRGVPSAEFIVNMTGYDHLLEFKSRRQIVVSARRSYGMPKRSSARISLNGVSLGEVKLERNEDQIADTFELSDTESPPTDAWKIRLTNPGGGMIISRVVIVIGG